PRGGIALSIHDALPVGRAEAAEATVRTRQAHVASLQQRLREADEERARMGALIEAERTSFGGPGGARERAPTSEQPPPAGAIEQDRKSTRLNSSHQINS